MLGSAGSNVGVATGSAIASSAFLAGPYAPVVAAAGAVVALASTIAGALHIGEGCGPTCVQATHIVDQAEVVLKQNLAAFQAGQVDKATAESTFTQVWNAVQQSCAGIPGAAGQNCVGDRQRGGKWDWFSYYYDPIANAPDTVTTYQSVNGANPVVDSVTSIAQMNVLGFPLWMVAGVVLLVGSLANKGKVYAS